MRPSDPRLRRHLAPARGPLVGVLAAGVVGSLLVIAQAWAVTGLVVAVVRSGDVERWGWVVLATLLTRAVVQWIGDRCASTAAVDVGTHLRATLTRAVVERGTDSSSGAVTALLTRGVAAAEPYLTRYLPALVLASVLPPLTVVAIATQDVTSAVIVLATLPLVPVFGALVGLATRDRANEQWRAMESLSSHFLDVMRGLPTLVAFRRAKAQSGTIGRITDRYRRASLRTLRLAFASSAVLELVATLSVALVAVTVGVRLAAGGLDLHTALVVLLMAPEAYWPLRRVGMEFHAASEGVATFEKVSALTETSGQEAAVGTPTPGADLVVEDLTMLYPGRSTPALEHLTAWIPARGVTVVTGPSGCGKSTLLSVIAGLVTPSSGQLHVGDAVPAGPEWQAEVAWLPQRPHFLAGSVRENLRLACPDASDEQLWQALRRVALEERVVATAAGLDTPVGEDGRHFSAGERARLALARLILADRPWVLVDEPTAHLDVLTEQVIADAIVELAETRAVVLVAHDPVMERLADHRLHLEPPARVPAPRRASAEPRAAVSPSSGPDELAPPAKQSFWNSTLIASLASASGVALTATAGWLIVQASTRPAVLTLLVAIVGVRTFGLARPVLRYAERLRSHDAALRLLARRRVEVYDALVPLVPGAIGRQRGDVLASVVDDVDSVVDRELRVRMPSRSFVLVCLAAAAFATWALPWAGLAVAGLSGGSALVAFLLARAGAAPAERASVAHRAELSDAVVEILQVRPELVIWQRVDRAVDTVVGASRNLGAATRRAGAWAASARAILLATAGAAIALVAALADPAVRSGSLSAPMAALLVLLPLALLDVALPLADAGALSARTDAAAARLDELTSTAPAVEDRPDGTVPTSHRIDLDHVDAGWSDSTALQDVSLNLEPGSRLGVVGRSGSGKSTLAALLLRFLDPTDGSVLIGQRDLRGQPLDEVRRTIGLVDDDPHLFASTLVENVRLARPEASDDDVEDALRQARLGTWLDSLPDGLHTWVGDGHTQVSGGERARLAVARSLLAGQPVLVLDEPTAHLDHATATELAEEILNGPRAQSVVWITHDSVGLDLVDDVLELDSLPSGAARTWVS